MPLFFGIVVCAGGCFFAGYEFAYAMQRKAHTHDWSKWHQEDAFAMTTMVRQCATCGLTEMRPIQ